MVCTQLGGVNVFGNDIFNIMYFAECCDRSTRLDDYMQWNNNSWCWRMFQFFYKGGIQSNGIQFILLLLV